MVFVNFQKVIPCPNVKPLYWRLSGDGSVWTVDWNIYQRPQSDIKQPVALLGFNTAQSWNCHRTGMAEVATREADHCGQCGRPRLQWSYFSIRSLFENPVNQMYAPSYRIYFIWNAILMNNVNRKCIVFFSGYWLFGVDQSWDDNPGGLGVEAWQARSVNITILSLAGGNSWMLRAKQTYYASVSMQSERIH